MEIEKLGRYEKFQVIFRGVIITLVKQLRTHAYTCLAFHHFFNN